MASKHEEVLEFSASLLSDVGVFDADNEGMMSYTHGEKVKPVTISKKRLVLPTKAFLREGDWTKRVAFTPLSEQINEGPSPVLNALKGYITERLKMTFRQVALSLIELAIDPKRHKKLSAKAGKYLVVLGTADQKTADTVRKVLDQVSEAPEKRSVTMYLKNGGKGGVLRSCMVSFPIMDDALNGETETFFGVTMPRKSKDKQLIVNLFEYILGDEPVRETYTQGSVNTDAPYLHCLLLSFHALATRFNHLIEVHSASCPELAGLAFNLGWSKYLDDFAEFARVAGASIPTLPGNAGYIPDESIFEVEAEDVAGKSDLDLPWDDKPHEPLRDTFAAKGEAPSPRDESQGRSLKDILGGKRREETERPRLGAGREPARRGFSDRGGRSW